MTREPAAIVAAVVVVLQLLAPGAVLFGFVDWAVEQLAWVETFVIAVSAVVGTLFVRARVVPVNPGE